LARRAIERSLRTGQPVEGFGRIAFVRHRSETVCLVREAPAKRGRDEWIPLPSAAGIPCSPRAARSACH